MYLFDTNILILGIAGKGSSARFLKKAILKKSVYISAISIAEFLVKPTKEEKRDFEDLLKISTILNVNEEVAKVAANYRKRHLKNSRVKLLDYLIAAQAKTNNLTLVTNNKSDFPMKDIKIISP